MRLPIFKTIFRSAFILLLSLTVAPLHLASAQSSGAFYTVQEGDTLSAIAKSFHCSTYNLQRLNYMSNPNVLTPGTKLYIPGFEDLNGEIIRTGFPAGETAHTISRSLHQGSDAIARLNFLTAPDALYAGQPFYELSGDKVEQTRIPLTSGISGLELAVLTSTNPWLAAEFNDLRAPWRLVQNDTLFFPGTLSVSPSLDFLSLSSVAVNPSPLEQGKTALLQVQSPEGITITGSLLDYPLHFFPDATGGFTALQGIPRLTDPGLAEFILTLSTTDGRTFSVQQNLLVKQMDYGVDSPLQVSDDTVDPAVTQPEFDKIMSIVADAPPDKMWFSAFQPPISNPERITSYYGRLRSYNGSTYDYFHSGIDYAGDESTPVLAAAPGIVVFAGALTVRGNATIISHGWGVYTGYWHQSRIDVKVGDKVNVGQQIGMVGMTGRVTGPHLHYDVIVGSVEVDPQDWFTSIYAGF